MMFCSQEAERSQRFLQIIFKSGIFFFLSATPQPMTPCFNSFVVLTPRPKLWKGRGCMFLCQFWLQLFLCSTSTTASSTWPPPTMTTLSTLFVALGGPSAWLLWVWCSSTMCCRTWREGSRLRNCGSASPWRWPHSPPEQYASAVMWPLLSSQGGEAGPGSWTAKILLWAPPVIVVNLSTLFIALTSV